MYKFSCYDCKALFKIEEIGGNDTDIIYCPNCGHDTLTIEKDREE